MLSINNGNQIYSFVITKIDYILVDGLVLTVVQLTGEITNITFNNTNVLNDMLQTIKNILWRQLATIPAIVAGIGYIYFINVCNVNSHSVESDNILINFSEGNSISILSANSYEATNHNQYLSNIFYSTHINEYIENKVKYYVDDGMSRVDIQTIIDNSNSGDVIIFENGTYNDMYFDLKDGVDMIMNDVEFISSANLDNRGLFKDLSAVSCKIFGRASFIFGPDNEGWLLYDQFEESDVYIEFYKIASQRPGHDTADICAAFHQRNGKLRCKGYSISGNRIRTYDSDAECKLIDIDILYNIIDNGDTHFFPSQGAYQDTLDIYIRNGYYEANGLDTPAVSILISADGSNINIICCNFVNNNPTYSGVIMTGGSTVNHVRIWHSDYYVSPTSSEPISLTDVFGPIEFYGECNSNNLLITNEYTGNFNVDADFEIQRPDEYESDEQIMGCPSLLTISDGESGRIIEITGVDNSDRYEVYRENIPISKSNFVTISDEILFGAGYRYRSISETGLKSIFTINYTANIMPLINKPIKSKYTIGDTVYYNNSGNITELTINTVYVYVDNPNNDSKGRQVNSYGFEETNQLIEESRLYSSKNSLLKTLKGEYLNQEGNSYFVTNSIDSNISDYLGMDISGYYLIGLSLNDLDQINNPGGVEFDMIGAITDDTNFSGCIMPASYNTQSEFRALVASYDKNTTIWSDGRPILNWDLLTINTNAYSQGAGTATVSSGSSSVVGTDTAWESYMIGLYIKLGNEFRLITAVADNTHLTVNSNFSEAHTDAEIHTCIPVDLSGSDLSDIDCVGTDFSRCIMPSNADTKAEFKALVGSYDSVTTIWIDGQPIGE